MVSIGIVTKYGLREEKPMETAVCRIERVYDKLESGEFGVCESVFRGECCFTSACPVSRVSSRRLGWNLYPDLAWAWGGGHALPQRQCLTGHAERQVALAMPRDKPAFCGGQTMLTAGGARGSSTPCLGRDETEPASPPSERRPSKKEAPSFSLSSPSSIACSLREAPGRGGNRPRFLVGDEVRHLTCER